MLEGKAKYFEITSEATDKYNEWLQKRLQKSVWTECTSFYRAKQGKIIGTFPGPVSLFWWLSLSPVWERYKAVGAEAWAAERRQSGTRKLILSVATLTRWTISCPLSCITQVYKSILSRRTKCHSSKKTREKETAHLTDCKQWGWKGIDGFCTLENALQKKFRTFWIPN